LAKSEGGTTDVMVFVVKYENTAHLKVIKGKWLGYRIFPSGVSLAFTNPKQIVECLA
jgi:hypothetical protein